MDNRNNRLKVEIWSDVVCPFCYIGKREFEKALESFPQKEQLDIEWKSYQLNPEMVTDTSKNIDQYLADAKGISIEAAHQMNTSVTSRAKEVGLDYHFEKAIPANTMKAHCLLHLAKKYNQQDAMEELLFRAYFTEGKNIDDVSTLVSLGEQLGLNPEEIKTTLENETYYDEVRQDIYDAFQLGVRGVPFFVFNRKYGVSGAQPDFVFTQTLEQSFSDWLQTQTKPLIVQTGETCDINGNCQ